MGTSSIISSKKGRPAKGPFENKSRALSTRITEKIRTKLDCAAADNGRSLSQEIEHRLEQSFRDEQRAEDIATLEREHHIAHFGGERGYRIAAFISMVIARVETVYGSQIENDDATRLAAQEAIEQLLMIITGRSKPSQLVKFGAGTPPLKGGKEITDDLFEKLLRLWDDKKENLSGNSE